MTSIEPRQIEMRKKIMKKLNPFKLYQDLKFEFSRPHVGTLGTRGSLAARFREMS